MCTQCHSFSAHLFEKLGSELGPWDGMTLKTDFCNALITECAGQIAFGGPAEYDGQTYCEKHVGGVNGADQFWSYPYVDRECAYMCSNVDFAHAPTGSRESWPVFPVMSCVRGRPTSLRFVEGWRVEGKRGKSAHDRVEGNVELAEGSPYNFLLSRG